MSNKKGTNELYCFECETDDNICVVVMEDYFLNVSLDKIVDGSLKLTVESDKNMNGGKENE